MVINKVTLSLKQKSGFIEDIKQNKSVQIFLPPLSGHSDCATDQRCLSKALLPKTLKTIECVLMNTKMVS